jgi:hypothetical protein
MQRSEFIYRAITLGLSASFICGPSFPDTSSCNIVGQERWRNTKLPAELENEVSEGPRHSVFKAVVNTHGDMGYMIRHDWDAGQHAAEAEIFVKSDDGWRSVFDGDVNLTEEPLVISQSSAHGYYDLCNQSPCCGDPPILYRFDGSGYKLVEQ